MLNKNALFINLYFLECLWSGKKSDFNPSRKLKTKYLRVEMLRSVLSSSHLLSELRLKWKDGRLQSSWITIAIVNGILATSEMLYLVVIFLYPQHTYGDSWTYCSTVLLMDFWFVLWAPIFSKHTKNYSFTLLPYTKRSLLS